MGAEQVSYVMGPGWWIQVGTVDHGHLVDDECSALLPARRGVAVGEDAARERSHVLLAQPDPREGVQRRAANVARGDAGRARDEDCGMLGSSAQRRLTKRSQACTLCFI